MSYLPFAIIALFWVVFWTWLWRSGRRKRDWLTGFEAGFEVKDDSRDKLKEFKRLISEGKPL